jgi:serine protease inhibitor
MKMRTRVLALAVLAGLPPIVPAAEPAPGPADAAATAGNAFGFDLYKQLGKDNPGKNLFFSPYSVESALAIVAEGARGETAGEMGKVLRFPADVRRAADKERPWDVGPIHAGFAAMNRQFDAASVPPAKAVLEKIAALRTGLDAANAAARRERNFASRQKAEKIAAGLNKLLGQVDRYELRVANALWGEKTYPFKQAFLDAINKHYRTGAAFPMDFKHHAEAARKEINDWVEKRTKDRVKELIPPKVLDTLTRLVVTNAISFKGEWAEPFSPKRTKQQPFALAGGKTVQTPLMERQGMKDARYGAFNPDGTFFATPARVPRGRVDRTKLYPGADGFEVLELPYKGGDLSMVVIAPRSAGGLAALEKKLSGENAAAWLGMLKQRRVNVFLPKFKLETKYTLNEPLKALGMKTAFKEPPRNGAADFQGMTDSPDPRDKLYITKVLHKAFVEVSEKGAEAAAATAVVMAVGRGMPASFPFTPDFRADRPFVFLIRDQKSGAILFLGRLTKP